jgi:hypothetical protein
VNRLPLSVAAACLMRSRALYMSSRLWVRYLFCEFAFPSACRLPSTPSACEVPPPLGSLGVPWPFPAFPPSCPFRSAIAPASACSALCSGASSVLFGSQTPCSVRRWLWSSDFPPRPMLHLHGQSQGLPVLAQCASMHVRGLRPRQAASCLASYRYVAYRLRSQKRPRHLAAKPDFAAQYPTCMYPYRRFGHDLSVVSTRLGAVVGG